MFFFLEKKHRKLLVYVHTFFVAHATNWQSDFCVNKPTRMRRRRTLTSLSTALFMEVIRDSAFFGLISKFIQQWEPNVLSKNHKTKEANKT